MGRHSAVVEPRDRRLARSAVVRVGARVVSSLAIGVCLLITARGTALADFGTFMTAYAVGLVVGLVAGFGAPVRALRAPAESRCTPGALFLVHTALVSAAFAVVLIASGRAGALGWAWFAGLVFAYGDTVQNYAQAQLTAADRQAAATTQVVLHRIVPLGAAVACFVALGTVDFAWLSAAFAVPVALGLAAPRAAARGVTPAAIRAVFTGWVGYWGYAGSAMIGQLQVPALSLVAAASTVAAFAMAQRVTGPVTLVTAAVTAVVVPELARRLGDPRAFARLYGNLVRACVGYLVLVIALSWPLALILVAMAGPQYSGATVLVAATVVGAGLSALSQAFNAKLLALDAPLRATVAIVLGGLLAVALLLAWGDRPALLWLVPVCSQLAVLAAMILLSSKGA